MIDHNVFLGLESPIQMSTFSFPVTSLGRSKSSSLRRRRRPGRHSVERENSVEKRNGEVSTSASGEADFSASSSLFWTFEEKLKAS